MQISRKERNTTKIPLKVGAVGSLGNMNEDNVIENVQLASSLTLKASKMTEMTKFLKNTALVCSIYVTDVVKLMKTTCFVQENIFVKLLIWFWKIRPTTDGPISTIVMQRVMRSLRKLKKTWSKVWKMP